MNCHYQDAAYTSIQLGGAGSNSITTTVEVTMPVLTNKVVVAKGATLTLHKVKVKAVAADKHWKEVTKASLASQERKQRKAAAAKDANTSGKRKRQEHADL